MLGEKIAEQRKKLGLSQEELAEKLNISQKSISKYELGDRNPQYKVLVRMAEYFGVTTDYLLRSTDTQDFGICDCGNTIKELRTEAGMTQEELGMLLNVQNAAVSKYESGKVPLTGETLLKLSKIFNVSTDYLLGLAKGGNTVLGERIAELRKACDMSQKELGEKLGVSASAIGMYEQGRREPNNAMMIAMEKLFGVTVDYLLGVTDSTENAPESSVARKFGNRLRDLRVSEGITQLQMAVNLDTSKSNISKYEAGTVEPGMAKINEIARFFKVTTDYLFGMETGGNTMLGKRINELRKSSGMTQEEFGKKLGVIKQTVSSWENDLSEPNHAATIAIAKLFGVTTDYLLGAEGDTMGTEEKINEITQRVGRNIRSIREQAGLSQRDFAEGFGISNGAVGMWETGKRQPDLNMLIQIAQFGGTSLDDLVTKDLKPVPLYVRNMIYLRKRCGCSQGELATILGLQGASSIDLVETGKCELPVSKLIYLAEFFGVTMDQITKKDLSQEVSGCRQQ